VLSLDVYSLIYHVLQLVDRRRMAARLRRAAGQYECHGEGDNE